MTTIMDDLIIHINIYIYIYIYTNKGVIMNIGESKLNIESTFTPETYLKKNINNFVGWALHNIIHRFTFTGVMRTCHSHFFYRSPITFLKNHS